MNIAQHAQDAGQEEQQLHLPSVTKVVSYIICLVGYDRGMAEVKQFWPRDISIIVRGLVEFPSNASEEVIRSNIAALIQNSDLAPSLDAKKYGPNDFEFVKRTRHTFIVPQFAPDFYLDLSALKTPIGQGDVYFRLMLKHEPHQLETQAHGVMTLTLRHHPSNQWS